MFAEASGDQTTPPCAETPPPEAASEAAPKAEAAPEAEAAPATRYSAVTCALRGSHARAAHEAPAHA